MDAVFVQLGITAFSVLGLEFLQQKCLLFVWISDENSDDSVPILIDDSSYKYVYLVC